MIKRQYFISADVTLKNGATNRCWRQFYFPSWLPDPVAALTLKLNEISELNDVTWDKITVIAFNRC